MSASGPSGPLVYNSHISIWIFSASAVFDQVSTAIRNYDWHAQPLAVKMSLILSHSATAWNNYIPAFLAHLSRRLGGELLVYQ